MTFNSLYRSSILSLTLISFIVAHNAQAGPSGEGGKRHGPPTEALQACENSSQGDSCSFTGRRGDTITGSCIVPRSQDGLACAPEGGPPADHSRREEQQPTD